MDLSLIQSQFADFATFANNIGKALQGFPNLLISIVDFFGGAEEGTETTSTNLDNLSS